MIELTGCKISERHTFRLYRKNDRGLRFPTYLHDSVRVTFTFPRLIWPRDYLGRFLPWLNHCLVSNSSGFIVELCCFPSARHADPKLLNKEVRTLKRARRSDAEAIRFLFTLIKWSNRINLLGISLLNIRLENFEDISRERFAASFLLLKN